MPNIEIKANYPDLEKGRQIARRLEAKFIGQQHQVDTYFHTPRGRLKLREIDSQRAELIPYFRENQEGPKVSEYLLVEVKEPKALKSLFERMLGMEIVVDKRREIYLLNNVRLHLDTVKELGCFLEFEAVYQGDSEEVRERETQKVSELMERFEVGNSALIRGSYRELRLERCQSPFGTAS